MKGLKFLVSCAAVAAVSAACATASFAITATPNLTKDVNADTYSGTVNVEAFDEYAKNVEGDLTLLVLNSDKADVTKDMIEQILQIPNDGNKTGVLSQVKLAGLEAGKTYHVRLGGADVSEIYANGFESVEFTVGGTTETPTVLIGDADGDKEITAYDCSEIAKKTVLMDSKVDDSDYNYYAAAYSDGDAEITAYDCSEVAKKTVLMDTTYVGNIVEIGTYGLKQVQTN